MGEQSSESWKGDRIGAAERGENPTVLIRMRSGFAVIGDTQFLPGYCLLLAVPKTGHLTDMPLPDRLEVLRDMSLLGEAIESVCEPSRINYEIAGNIEPFVHAHVIPRYAWEPDEYLRGPASLYPPELRRAPEKQYSDVQHGGLKTRLTTRLLELMVEAGAEVS